MADLESALGHVFEDRDLLGLALTHRSAVRDGDAAESNERLEFLGDAVLDLVVTSHLYETWDMDEGELSQLRASVIGRKSLVRVADAIDVGEHLLMGGNADAEGARERDSVLADSVEALLGAVYLDAGLEAATRVIMRHWAEMVESASEDPGRGDHKSRLQVVLARDGRVPAYEVEGHGPDHDRHFEAAVYDIPDPGQGVERVVHEDRRAAGPLGEGTGTSKKRAERDAARQALRRLGELDA